MVGFIVGAVLLLAALIFGITALRLDPGDRPDQSYIRRYAEWESRTKARKLGWPILGLGVILFAVCTGTGSFYTQDPGEGVVQRSISGEVVGETWDSGFHMKPFWVSAQKWDIRDNTVQYIAGGEQGYDSGSVTGPRITVQDADGVDANFDLTVRYSIKGDHVGDLYSRYGAQENVLSKVVEPGIRSAMREIPVTYSTLDILNERAAIQEQVRERLDKEFSPLGIVIEDVDIQEIVQPEAIKKANAAKAAALASVETEKAKLEKAKIEAKKNQVKTEALTPEILQQQYIEAIKNGTVFVIEEGSTPILDLKK